MLTMSEGYNGVQSVKDKRWIYHAIIVEFTQILDNGNAALVMFKYILLFPA